MNQLNYHHLRYFHAVVQAGTLTAAAKRLHVSQSSLSIQLKKLEESLDCALFDRSRKTLRLSEEGRMVFDYAETIFSAGEEMLATLQNRSGRYATHLRVGAVATLSRNFQLDFLGSVLRDESVEVILHSASLNELLGQLRAHTLDVVLSNQPVPEDHAQELQNHAVAEQPVSLVARRADRRPRRFRFPADLVGQPLVLPGRGNEIRRRFDLLLEQAGIAPLVAAEADDMAMLRLLARELPAITLLPPVVVKDELASGFLRTLQSVPDLSETFYAITAKRRFPSPHLAALLERPEK